MSTLSVTMSTNRNLDKTKKIYESIKNCYSDDFEFIVFSPDDPGPEFKWIKEQVPSYGGVIGYNVTSYYAQGEYILALGDDEVMVGDFNKTFKDITEHYELGNEHKAWTVTRDYMPHFVDSSDVLDAETSTKVFKSCLKLGHPLIKKDLINKHYGGFLWNLGFKHHYVDNWIGVWNYYNNIPAGGLNHSFMKNISNETFRGSTDSDAAIYKGLCRACYNGFPYQAIFKSHYELAIERYRRYLPSEELDKFKDWIV